MITDSIDCRDVESTKELLSSPADSPQQCDSGDASCGLSTTTSDSFSQPNSWSSRHDSPGGKGSGGLSSYMPIVDEEDCSARNSPRGHTSSEEEQSISLSAPVKAYHKAAYERQVRQWQQVESFYMKHAGWVEHRVILLLQEAFRCSYVNLKQAHDGGTLSDDVFAARAAELRTSLVTIKKEYRRTLERTKERNGDLAGVASKAVTCIASVYPWSSEGFLMGFEENMKYGDLAGAATNGSSTRRLVPVISPSVSTKASVVVVPASNPAAVLMPTLEPEGAERDCDEGDDLSIAESVVAGGRSRRVAMPCVTLRPLPPCRQLFQPPTGTSTAAPASGSGSPVVSPSRSAAPATPTFTTTSSPQVDSLVRGGGVASPPLTAPRSPVPVPPPSIAGPLRASELRFLEKRQLILQGMAFVSRSLASSSFIASRRAAIAAATMRQRLGQAKAKDDVGTPSSAAAVARVSPVVPAPTLPTRYLMDVGPMTSEAAAFDSNPNSFTRRSNPGGATNRAVLSNPTLYCDLSTSATLSLSGSVTKCAVSNVNNNRNNNSSNHRSCISGCHSVANASPVACTASCGSMPNSGPLHSTAIRSLPHSYSARNNVPATAVVQSHPHSYTAHKTTGGTNANVGGVAVAPTAMLAPPYGVAPCSSFRAEVLERAEMPTGLPTYGQKLPASHEYPAVYAALAMPATAVVPPPPPPCYTSHIRRDRLCAQSVSFPPPFPGMPPLSSVEDDQFVKELW
jgi:hypothetical protein